MRFIDTHCHISDEAFQNEQDAIVQKGLDAGVFKMLQADIDIKERSDMFALVGRHPGVLHPMLGLYPGSVKEDWEKEIEALDEWKDKGIVAIGEIGLDFHWDTTFMKEQKNAFRTQLEMACSMDLPVNIHLRDATEAFFEVMDSCKHLTIKGNLHAYSGSFETFQRLQKYGEFMVGIGGVVTFKKAALAETVKKIPLESILLETDAPYLSPTPLRGTRNDSSNIPLIAAKIAELKQVDIEQVAEITTANAQRLFRI